METKIELCKTEMETEFFWWKWKWKWNNVFWRNRRGNGISVFDWCGISVLLWFCMVNLTDPIQDLVKPNHLNNPCTTPCYTKKYW
jgi:hypothetical protein